MLYPAELRARMFYSTMLSPGLQELSLSIERLIVSECRDVSGVRRLHFCLLPEWEELLALPSDCDAGTAGEVELLSHLATGADVFRDTEPDHLRHPSCLPVPVHLEPFGVPLIQVVGSDEVEADAVSVGAGTGDHDGLETGLRVSSKLVGGKDLEHVAGVSGNRHLKPRGVWVDLRGPSPPCLYYTTQPSMLHEVDAIPCYSFFRP